jgi:SAM-dependent methyltransferase
MIKKKIKKEFLHNITKHGVISGFYFNYIIKNIFELILINKKVKILDFGCGYGYLKKRLKKAKNIKIINFDIIKELTEIDDWKKVNFDYLVSTHVFMYLGPKKLNRLLLDLKNHNKNLKLITIISRQGLLNNIGKFILNEPDAHKGTLLNANNELKILKKKMRIVKKKNILCLSDIYLLEFL